MRTRLRGVHSVRSGGAVYHYHRASRARLTGEPGTPEFLASLAKAEADWQARVGERAEKRGTLAHMIAEYRSTLAFQSLAPRTRADYGRAIARIEDRFGSAPLAAFADRRIRAALTDWRDQEAARSPKWADYALTVLVLILNAAVERGRLKEHAAHDLAKVYRPDRSERVWSADQIERLMEAARPELRLAIAVAIGTGLRQGDLIRLTWAAWDGHRIAAQTRKRGVRVEVPATETLRQTLNGAHRRGLFILTDSRGRPWKENGFRLAWGRLLEKAGLADAGLTFHDLRGTAGTQLAEAGATEIEIATIMGIGTATARKYIARTRAISEAGIAKLDAARRAKAERKL
jgi:integrase